MKILPLSDHILIEPIKREEKTKSGILLPETAEKEKPEQGKIIAVGPGKKTEDGIILGTYSSLYDYIYIYKDNNDSRTIYHEIGHIIYKNLFIEVKSNLEIWKDFYNQLKEANLLSTQYSYTNEIEGFSEEYSVYKTGFKQQPQEVVNFFKDVEDKIN